MIPSLTSPLLQESLPPEREGGGRGEGGRGGREEGMERGKRKRKESDCNYGQNDSSSNTILTDHYEQHI